jgi:hypothetical protein
MYVRTEGPTYRGTDMTKEIVAFVHYANACKNYKIFTVSQGNTSNNQIR